MKLPQELIIVIAEFLKNAEILPFNTFTKKIFLSNIVWKPRVHTRFKIIESNNYFKEYCWQLHLERHQMSYKRQWTLGCVGKLSPIQKPFWTAAAF